MYLMYYAPKKANKEGHSIISLEFNINQYVVCNLCVNKWIVCTLCTERFLTDIKQAGHHLCSKHNSTIYSALIEYKNHSK